MVRIALISLAIYLVWRLLRWAFAGAGRTTRKSSPKGTLGAAEMVACTGCGTFVIKAEAINLRGNNYCSNECANRT